MFSYGSATLSFSSLSSVNWIEWGPAAYVDGASLRARRELQLAATLAISNLVHAGRAGTWLMHNIEHAVSAHYDIPHGLGMAIVMPRVMSYLKPHITGRLAQLGKRCFGVRSGGATEMAENTIDRFTAWLEHLDRNLTFADIGIDNSKFAVMADDVIRNDGDGKVYHSVVELGKAEIIEILEYCLVPA